MRGAWGRWEAAAGRPGVRSLYLSLMDALTAVNADSLFFIQAVARDMPHAPERLTVLIFNDLCRRQACAHRGSSAQAPNFKLCMAQPGTLTEPRAACWQGCGQQGLSPAAGGGFATDAALVASLGLSDPTTFFKTLLLRPYLRQVGRLPRRPSGCGLLYLQSSLQRIVEERIRVAGGALLSVQGA